MGKTQGKIRDLLVEKNVPFTEADGEAAFYGPKIDIQAKNVYGKEDTMITIQLDCAIAENFDMYFIDQNVIRYVLMLSTEPPWAAMRGRWHGLSKSMQANSRPGSVRNRSESFLSPINMSPMPEKWQKN